MVWPAMTAPKTVVKYSPPVFKRLTMAQRKQVCDAMQMVMDNQYPFEKYNSGDARADWAGYWANEFIRCCTEVDRAETG